MNLGKVFLLLSTIFFLSCDKNDSPIGPIELCIELSSTNPIASTLNIQAYSNDGFLVSGQFSGNTLCLAVPRNTALSIKLFTALGCKDFVYAEDLEPAGSDISIVIELADDLFSNSNTISGNMVDCQGNPVPEGIVYLANATDTIETNIAAGSFVFLLEECAESSYSIFGIDIANNKLSDTLTVSLDSTGATAFATFPACNNFPEKVFYGSISTVDQLEDLSKQRYTKIVGSIILRHYPVSGGNAYTFTEITGKLSLGWPFFDNIQPKTLAVFRDLSTIGGSLELYYAVNLLNLDGLENLTSIGANLILGSEFLYSPSSITNLDPLRNLKHVGKDIQIYGCSKLTNIDALLNITSVSGNLLIQGNGLADLHGLSNLTAVSGSVSIVGNSQLTDVSGLKGLSNYTGILLFERNWKLATINLPWTTFNGSIALSNHYCTTLDGLASLTYLKNLSLSSFGPIGNTTLKQLGNLNLTSLGSLYIDNQDALVDMQGLSELTKISRTLTLVDNKELGSVDGLNQLASVGGLSIYANPKLAHLNGLSGLVSIGGSVHIGLNIYGGNSSLTNLDGLSNLTFIGANLRVERNTVLTSLCGLRNVVVGGAYLVSNNAYNPTLEQLKTDECEQQ